MDRYYRKTLIALARNLRQKNIPAEQKLWQKLRLLYKSHGVRFRRQQPLGHYIADFACLRHKLVIEIDGRSHEHMQMCDAERDDFMNQEGYRVLRFLDVDILKNCDVVVETILHEIESLPMAENTPHPCPLPQGERET